MQQSRIHEYLEADVLVDSVALPRLSSMETPAKICSPFLHPRVLPMTFSLNRILTESKEQQR